MTTGMTTTQDRGGQKKVGPALRLLRLLANSRELTLGILVLSLVVVMSIAFLSIFRPPPISGRSC